MSKFSLVAAPATLGNFFYEQNEHIMQMSNESESKIWSSKAIFMCSTFISG